MLAVQPQARLTQKQKQKHKHPQLSIDLLALPRMLHLSRREVEIAMYVRVT